MTSIPTPPVRAFTGTVTDPYGRGAQLGRRHAGGVHASWAGYRALWRAFGCGESDVRAVGEAVLDPVRAFSPCLWEELRGVADGAGLPLPAIGALNARTELLARGGWGAEECTTVVGLPADRDPWTVQTWDWHVGQADTWFVWTLRHPDGTVVSTLTEYGILGKIGVSSHRLSVHFNALGHRHDTGDGGVPVHIVARRILDEARSVPEAVAIAAEATVTASSAVTVTGPGEPGWCTAMIELHPGGPTVVAGDAAYVVHTNHFLQLPDRDQVRRPGSTSRQRLERVRTRAATESPVDRDAVVRLLADHALGPRGLCAHPEADARLGERTATLAVVATEPGHGVLHVHAGAACTAVEDGRWFTASLAPTM